MREMLTPVEQQVARCALNNLSHQQTARHLNLSENVVRDTLNSLYRRLGISSALELFLCVCSGMVTLTGGEASDAA